MCARVHTWACAAWAKKCQQKWSISDLNLTHPKMPGQHGDTPLNLPIRRLRQEGLEFKVSLCIEGDGNKQTRNVVTRMLGGLMVLRLLSSVQQAL